MPATPAQLQSDIPILTSLRKWAAQHQSRLGRPPSRREILNELSRRHPDLPLHRANYILANL